MTIQKASFSWKISAYSFVAKLTVIMITQSYSIKINWMLLLSLINLMSSIINRRAARKLRCMDLPYPLSSGVTSLTLGPLKCSDTTHHWQTRVEWHHSPLAHLSGVTPLTLGPLELSDTTHPRPTQVQWHHSHFAHSSGVTPHPRPTQMEWHHSPFALPSSVAPLTLGRLKCSDTSHPWPSQVKWHQPPLALSSEVPPHPRPSSVKWHHLQ